ncbi:GrpB family protein [Vibrio sp. SCSIO 43136]|uniref:GrpB family protein n=1 Tax=Vibrio sp. SCSIO 43136 TaxID=2819101 RepID=UPI002075352D|nr:GrpB family protein [Vibrio sp. SCSIO 43136]USD64280.1 GrpB family protein [Vibrio sp. SCSIO 43136]
MKFYDPCDYQAKCDQLFAEYKPRIEKLLPHATIEHIGASSVPNLISKGDLDIYIGVEAGLLEASVETLKKIGFEEKSGTLRTDELCMLESQRGDDVALQVVAQGSRYEFFLKFRDCLRANPVLVDEYNILKSSSMDLSHDEYRAKKSVFIQRVLDKGE